MFSCKTIDELDSTTSKEELLQSERNVFLIKTIFSSSLSNSVIRHSFSTNLSEGNSYGFSSNEKSFS